MENTRRNFIKTGAILSAGTIAGTHMASGAVNELVHLFPHIVPFELPPLPYTVDALEPYIDAQTMQIHHDKHHQAYITKLNEALAKDEALHHQTIDALLMNMHTFSEVSRTAVRNQGGGHWNHSFFWTLLKKDTAPTPAIQKAITKNFGSMETFKKDFEKAASGVFGSGWAWVILTGEGKLVITTTANQDNPLMSITSQRGKPIMGIDVWEHAYYLKYQNKRAEYLNAYWNVLNWNRVEELYLSK
jgi:Fe-Mn family superoxide dismutase